jgi:hypothetical protein
MEISNSVWNKKNTFIFASANILNSLWIFHVYLTIAPIGYYQPANFSNILEGTAERPFIYRALIPLIAKTFSWLVPDKIVIWAVKIPPPLKAAFERLSGEVHSKEAIVAIFAMFFSLVAFGFVERTFTASLGLNKKTQFVLPLFAQLMLLPLSYHFGYYYDLPQVLLVASSLLFLYRQNWPVYSLLFAITTLNKETTITLVIVYGIYYFSRLPRRKFLGLLLSQLLLYTLIRVPLIFLYRNNPGASIPSKLGIQLYIYTEFPIILFITFLFFSIIFLYVFKRWKQVDEFLRASLAIFAVIFILFFLSGIPMEFRVFLDALPVLAIWVYPFKLTFGTNLST